MPDPRLKHALDRLADEYGGDFLDSDPAGIVRRYREPADIEVAGLVTASLGYGAAPQIRRSAENALLRMGESPARCAVSSDIGDILARFRGFRHRWTDGADMALLVAAAGAVIREFGSIGALVRSLDDPREETVGGTIERFAGRLLALSGRAARCAGIAPRTPFIFPSPADGSACKRPAMYFRWMARGPDAVDFGLWIFISPARLVVPVDRHMARMAALLGLTGRKTPDWRMALEITRALRELDPADPLRYDFALVRPGILRACTAAAVGMRAACALGDVCREAACV